MLFISQEASYNLYEKCFPDASIHADINTCLNWRHVAQHHDPPAPQQYGTAISHGLCDCVFQWRHGTPTTERLTAWLMRSSVSSVLPSACFVIVVGFFYCYQEQRTNRVLPVTSASCFPGLFSHVFSCHRDHKSQKMLCAQ